MTRKVHLLGSVPVESADASYGLAKDVIGEHISAAIPDGETGERSDWVIRLIERLRNHPDLELAHEGDWSGYDETPAFRVKKGHTFDWVDLDYVEEFRSSWPAFDASRSDLPPDTAFQVGVPGPLDLAAIAFGFDLRAAMRHLAPFRDATVREISIIADITDDVVFQLELPIESGAVYRAPPQLAKPLSAMIAREVVRPVRRGPVGARYGLHFCNGDMNNEAMITPDSLTPLVALVNSVIAAWPSSRPLEFVHLPFGGGTKAAPTEPSFFEPLGRLRIPSQTRLIAGFVHESETLDTAAGRLDIIEGIVGHDVDVAAPCGLGRRDIEAARANLELSRELVTAN